MKLSKESDAAKAPLRKARAEALKKTVKVHAGSARFIAHRGYSDEAPENTVKAFELAAEEGFHSMETDIRYTKDGKPVLIHDASLKRMCGVDKKVCDLTYEEIRKIPITGGRNNGIYHDDIKATRIPNLKEFLIICRDNGMVPMMELKDNWNVEEPLSDEVLSDIVRRTREVMEDRPVIYVSFNLNSLLGLKHILSEQGIRNVTLFHIVSVIDTNMIPFYKENGIQVSCNEKKNKLHDMKKVRDAGLTLVVWTVNNMDQARLFVHERIEWIASNKKLWT